MDDLKIGLEIHQRLNTKKLFCRCPSVSEGKIVGVVRRKLHVVKSELGEKDVAAQKEELRDRIFEYAVFDNSCLVECDEEPPHPMNKTAFLTALAVAGKLKMNIADEIFVMRKTVIDGSNTSGFQRTAVIGLDGEIESSRGRVGIQTLCIEEESAGIMGDQKEGRFGLDRLGIPLIEIATAPDIIDGIHAREVAESIGMMLRMTGVAARGIGTIRQDLNVSIGGGARVEIKGVQDLDDIPTIIENEVARQKGLIGIIEKIRDAKKPEKIKHIDVGMAFGEGKEWIKEMLAKGGKAIAVKLPGLHGLLGAELCSGRRYGTELSDHAKSFGFGGLMHGDEDFSKYNVDKRKVEKMLRPGKNDSYIILIGEFGDRMMNAFSDIISRAYLQKVPSETRRYIGSGATQYMRPMATGARMYPETDIEPLIINRELMEAANQYAPKDASDIMRKLEKETNRDLARQLIKSQYLNIYTASVKKGIDPKVAAVTLVNTLKSISRERLDVEFLGDEVIMKVLESYRNGAITKKAIEEVLRALCLQSGESVEEIIDKKGLRRIKGPELKKLIEKEGNDVGKIMAKYRLRIEAEELMKIIRG